VAVPCPAWGIRLTLPQLIHGSTARSIRRRRTILPWYMHVDADHKKLEIDDCLSWKKIRQCHMDLEVPARDPSSYSPRLGAPKERFGGSVILGSTSALEDALVGRRKWTDPEVLRDRDILLVPDSKAAVAYVTETRAHLVEQYRIAFVSMQATERQQYGQNSYFWALENGGDPDEIPECDAEGSSDSDDSLSLPDTPSEGSSLEDA
jgi:hypothetical protein